MFLINKAYAALSAQQFGVSNRIGNIFGIQWVFNFIFNFFVYIGWVGTVFGIGYTIFLLIYKLYSGSDSSEDIEKFRDSITKAIVIAFSGIVLLSAGYIVKVVGTFLGINLPFNFWINSVFSVLPN